MDERERVDELDRERRRHHPADRRAERLADRERDHRTHPLAADLERVAHGRRLAVQLRPELEALERLVDERLQLVRTVHRPPPRVARSRQLLLDRLRELRQLAEQLDRALGRRRPLPRASCSSSARTASTRTSSSSARVNDWSVLKLRLSPARACPGSRSPASQHPRMHSRFASVTASSRTTSTGTSPSSSSSSATRRTLRSTAPSRSAVQSSDADVIRSSSPAACSVTASASCSV